MKKIIFLVVAFCFFLTSCNFFYEPKEDENTGDVEKIMPLPSTIDISNLKECTLAVSLNKGDAYVDDNGIMQMKVTVYDYDLYDMVDISTLKEEDIIVIGKKDVRISTLERSNTGTIIINGGLDQGGYELVTDESGVFYETGYSDVKSYYSIGEAVIRVSTEFK